MLEDLPEKASACTRRSLCLLVVAALHPQADFWWPQIELVWAELKAKLQKYSNWSQNLPAGAAVDSAPDGMTAAATTSGSEKPKAESGAYMLPY